jgi:transposase
VTKFYDAKMARAKYLTVEQQTTISSMQANGLTTKAISDILTIKQNTIRNYLWRNKHQIQSNMKKKRGRKRKLSTRQIRYLRNAIKHNRFNTLNEIRIWFIDVIKVQISKRTMRRHMKSLGYNSFKSGPKASHVIKKMPNGV